MRPRKVQTANIPAVLAHFDSWLVWKLVPNPDPTKKPLKVPFYVTGKRRRGTLGTTEDRRRLASFSRACEVYESGGYTGIGFAPMPEHEITILDLDDVVGEAGEYSEFAQQVIDTGTYVEYSPSRRGLRAVYTGGAVIPGKKNSHIANGERVEIYCGNAFVTMTGDIIDSTDPIDMPSKIKKVLRPVIDGAGGGTSNEPVSDGDGGVLAHPDSAPVPELTVDHAKIILNKLPETWGQPGHGTWYRVAAAMHLQFDGAEEAYDALDSWSQGIEGYDEAANRRRWKAGFGHAAGKEGLTTMRNLVFEAVNNGGLRVRKETMVKWGLARKVEEDFDLGEGETGASLPEYSELNRLSDIGGMLDTEAEPVDWLVENLIPKANVTILAGGSGTSKSYMTMQLCARAAIGMEDFGGMKIKVGGFRTLYMAYEDTRNVIHNRIGHLREYLRQHSTYDADLDEIEGGPGAEYLEDFRANFRVLTSEVLDSGAFAFVRQGKKYEPVEVTEFNAYLRDYVSTEGIDLVVVDTSSESHSADENSTADMVVLTRCMRQLASATGAAVLIVQHVQKGIWDKRLDDLNQSTVRGSSVLVDKARNVVMLARMPKLDARRFGLPDTAETHNNVIVLKHVKANLGEYVPLTIFERNNRGLLVHRDEVREIDPQLQAVDEAAAETAVSNVRTMSRMEEARNAVLDYIVAQNEQGVTPSQRMIRAQVLSDKGVSDDRIRTAITYLEGSGHIEKSANPEYPRSSNYRVAI